MLTGSGEPEEDEQALWLEQVMAEAGERRVAWFLHRPLFLEDPGEGDTGAVLYELDNATLTARIAEVPGLTQNWWPSVAASLELANPH